MFEETFEDASMGTEYRKPSTALEPTLQIANT
jgi:hypothetical protein